jgi:hypothetical protein
MRGYSKFSAIAGHGRPKDGVASLAYHPAIHETAPRAQATQVGPATRRIVDARVKPGMTNREAGGPPWLKQQ